MTKSQKKIYDWLLSKPGYLKKDYFTVAEIFFKPVGNLLKTQTKDTEEALKQARIDHKLGVKVINPVKKKVSKASTVNIISAICYDDGNVLEISDLHEPFCKDGYLEHCIKIRDKYKCGKVVLIGDEVDLCGVSQWEKDPDGFSAGTEAYKAQEKMKLWYKAFPEAKVCIGNHTARPFRQAKANGIPKKFMKTYEEAWEAPEGWQWGEHWEVNGVLYTHGTGMSGANAAIKLATRYRQNVVIGHIHSEAGIQYSASKIDLVWGKQLGGALDDSSYAAYYAKDQLKKSIVGCGVTIDGKLPLYEPMIL